MPVPDSTFLHALCAGQASHPAASPWPPIQPRPCCSACLRESPNYAPVAHSTSCSTPLTHLQDQSPATRSAPFTHLQDHWPAVCHTKFSQSCSSPKPSCGLHSVTARAPNKPVQHVPIGECHPAQKLGLLSCPHVCIKLVCSICLKSALLCTRAQYHSTSLCLSHACVLRSMQLCVCCS